MWGILSELLVLKDIHFTFILEWYFQRYRILGWQWFFFCLFVCFSTLRCLSIIFWLALFFLPNRFSSVQFSHSVVSDFATPWIAAHQASLSITNSWSLLKLMPIESVMPSSHLILCRPLLLLPPIPPSIRVFSKESTPHQVAKVLEFQLQHQSFQWTPRTDLL